MPPTLTERNPSERPVNIDTKYVKTCPTDLSGKPYTPVRNYSWLTEERRAFLAGQFDCRPTEIEFRFDARAAMDAKIAERREYEDPYGYESGRY